MFKKIRKPAIVLTTVCALMFSVVTFAATDNNNNNNSSKHWAADTMQKWVSEGLLKGDASGDLKPNQSITRAEFVALVNRVFNYGDLSSREFKDVSTSKWYAEEFSKAFAAGIVKGNAQGLMNPTASITRAEVAVVLANAFQLTAQNSKAYSGFADGESVAAWARDAVSVLVEKQYVQGRTGNKFAPSAHITRAEAIVMIDNVMGYLLHTPGTYTHDASGNAILNVSDIKLDKSVVEGNLYLTSGINDGDASLQDVSVKGNVYVEGGGVNSIKIDNSSIDGELKINRKKAPVRVVLSGNSIIGPVVFHSAGQLSNGSTNPVELVTIAASSSTTPIVLTGKIKHLIIESGTAVDLSNAIIDILEIRGSGAGAVVTLDASSSIGKVLFNGAASLKGAGKIGEAQINASGVTIEQSVALVTVQTGLTAMVNGKEVSGTIKDGGNPGGGYVPSTPDPVGTVKFFSFADTKVPVQLRDYHLVLKGEKTLDYTLTLQPSIFPVSGDDVVASALDKEGKVWVATSNELTRFNIYETDSSKVETFQQDEKFKGEIQALLVENEFMWVLTDESVSQIKYK